MSKNKLKFSKSIIKRFKITANNAYLRRKAGHSHLLEKKNAVRKQQLRKTVKLNYSDLSRFKRQLLYLKSK